MGAKETIVALGTFRLSRRQIPICREKKRLVILRDKSEFVGVNHGKEII